MDIRQSIAALGPWYHNFHLQDGIQTAPDHFLGDFPSFKWSQIESSIPENLANWSCLDIGCSAGFYSFELAKRGARVTGIDSDPHSLKQAEWIAQQLNLKNPPTFLGFQRNTTLSYFWGFFITCDIPRWPLIPSLAKSRSS